MSRFKYDLPSHFKPDHNLYFIIAEMPSGPWALQSFLNLETKFMQHSSTYIVSHQI